MGTERIYQIHDDMYLLNLFNHACLELRQLFYFLNKKFAACWPIEQIQIAENFERFTYSLIEKLIILLICLWQRHSHTLFTVDNLHRTEVSLIMGA